MAAVEILMHFLTLLIMIARWSSSLLVRLTTFLHMLRFKFTIMWNTNPEMTSESFKSTAFAQQSGWQTCSPGTLSVFGSMWTNMTILWPFLQLVSAWKQNPWLISLEDLCKPWLTSGDMSGHQGMFNYPNLYPFDQTTYKFEIDTNLYPFDADQLHMCHMQMLCRKSLGFTVLLWIPSTFFPGSELKACIFCFWLLKLHR